MVILVDDESPYSIEPGFDKIQLDIRLAPAVTGRFPFVRWGLLLFGVVCLLVGLVFMFWALNLCLASWVSRSSCCMPFINSAKAVLDRANMSRYLKTILL